MVRVKLLAELVEGLDPVIGPIRLVHLHQALPQPRLPVGSRPLLPVPDPVRAVEEAPVVDPGQAIGEIQPLAGVPVRR